MLTPQPPNIFKTAVELHSEGNFIAKGPQSAKPHLTGISYSDKYNKNTYDHYLGSKIDEYSQEESKCFIYYYFYRSN